MSVPMPARVLCGEAQLRIPAVPYLVDIAPKTFAEFEQVILISALNPAATFAYKNIPTRKTPGS